jgi:hypothetical protein
MRVMLELVKTVGSTLFIGGILAIITMLISELVREKFKVVCVGGKCQKLSSFHLALLSSIIMILLGYLLLTF